MNSVFLRIPHYFINVHHLLIILSVWYVIFLNILLPANHEVTAVPGAHTPAVATTRVLIWLLEPQWRPCRNEGYTPPGALASQWYPREYRWALWELRDP